MTVEVLETKLYVPQLRARYVPRSRLVARLKDGLHRRVTLLSAPAGYGKTTLIAIWLGHLDQNVAWLTLDESDNDSPRFLVDLIAALRKMQARIGRVLLERLQAPGQLPPEEAMIGLINDLDRISSPFILVFEDYHIIRSLATHRQLNFLVEHLPPQMHLVILTREDPPLPLARLRANGQLLDIRQDDLRFTVEEASDFLHRVMGMDLDRQQVAALARRTEGWITGLKLAALSLQSHPEPGDFIRAFTGSSRYILDYLMEEVFEQQPAEVQQFLLRTSILDQLSGPLCDAVTRRSGCQKMIEKLEAANLFVVPLDNSREWYRYHRLFRDLLRHRLQFSAKICAGELHRQAALWYQEMGLDTQAMSHALAAKDWDLVKRLLTSAVADVLKVGRIATLERWSACLPVSVAETDYRLATFKAWTALFSGIEGQAGSSTPGGEIPPDVALAERGTLFTLRSSLALAQNDLSGTVHWASKAIEIFQHEDPEERMGGALMNLARAQMFSGDLESAARTYWSLLQLGQKRDHVGAAVPALCDLAIICNLRGTRGQAVSLGQQALQLSRRPHGSTTELSAPAQRVLGTLFLESNELERARRCWSQVIELSIEFHRPSWKLAGLFGLADCEWMMGEQATAFALVQEAHQIVMAQDCSEMRAQTAAFQAELDVRSGNLSRAAYWSEELGFSARDVPCHQRERQFFTYARLLLGQKRHDELDTLLATLEEFGRQGGRIRTLISVRLLQGRAQLARGRRQPAISRTQQAIRLAAPGNYLRAFLDEGPDIADLLADARRTAPHFVDSLFAELATRYQSAAVSREPLSGQKLIDPLSPRELEVLDLVCAGLSNREISHRLHISVGTVKTHVHHIYGKLAVRNRTEAVARAGELSLVE